MEKTDITKIVLSAILISIIYSFVSNYVGGKTWLIVGIVSLISMFIVYGISSMIKK